MNNRENEEKKEESTPSILALEENTKGDDHWIGDVHGGLTAFKMWLDTLKPGDRGFCVGDLVDRGEDSPGVIAAIIENNKDPNKAKVYVVPGNHEDLTLEAITGLEVIAATLKLVGMDADRILKEIHDDFMRTKDQDPTLLASSHPALQHILKAFPNSFNANIAAIDLHLLNGGNWLVDLFAQELKKGINSDSPESRVGMVRDYMSGLPDIIYVNSPIPVVGVHADMPIDDKELIMRARLQLGLDEIEKKYSIWARELKKERNPNDIYMDDIGRNIFSILAIVGHNIVGGAATSALRYLTNTLDLDVASFAYGAILSVNVTKGTVSWIHPPNVPIEEFYAQEAKMIEKHMARELELSKFTTEVKSCTSIDELATAIEKYSGTQYTDGATGEVITLDQDDYLDLAFRRDAISEVLIMNEMKKGDLKELLEYGLSANYTFKDNSSLLDRAINNKDVESVRTLLNSDVDINYENPIAAACTSKNEDIIMLMNQFLLFKAIAENDEFGMQKAINRGADPFKVLGPISTFHFAQQHNFLDELIDISYQRAKKSDYLPDVDYSKQQTHGWSKLHAAALLGLEVDNKAQFNLNAKANIPAGIFDLLLARQQNMPGLDEFYAKHPSKNGMIEVSVNDLKRIRGLEVQEEVQQSPKTSQRGMFASSPRKEGAEQIAEFKKKH